MAPALAGREWFWDLRKSLSLAEVLSFLDSAAERVASEAGDVFIASAQRDPDLSAPFQERQTGLAAARRSALIDVLALRPLRHSGM